MIANSSVHVPGVFSPSAVGLPEVSVQARDTAGNVFATNSIAVVSATNRDFGNFFREIGDGTPLKMYLPAGTYSLFASSSDLGLEIYQPGVTIVSSSDPGFVTINASLLPKDTFSFDLDNLNYGYVYLWSPDNYGHYQS